MKLERTAYACVKLIVDEFGIYVGVLKYDKEVIYQLYDTVYVKADTYGRICPGINHEGTGRIIEIRPDSTGYFYGILVDGEFGYIKDTNRILLRQRKKNLLQ